MSSENITTIQKSLLLHTFYEIPICFLLQKNEDKSDRKNHRDFLALFLLIMQIVFLLQDNAILLRLESLK